MIHIIREDPEGYLVALPECDGHPEQPAPELGEPMAFHTAKDWWFLRQAESDLDADYDLCALCGKLWEERNPGQNNPPAGTCTAGGLRWREPVPGPTWHRNYNIK